MMIIYKYPLRHVNYQVLELPYHIKALSVGVQKAGIHIDKEVICLWGLVDPEAILQEVPIVIVATGVEVDVDGYNFVGTVNTGPNWWHVFIGDAN
jgi:hypothetical protein